MQEPEGQIGRIINLNAYTRSSLTRFLVYFSKTSKYEKNYSLCITGRRVHKDSLKLLDLSNGKSPFIPQEKAHYCKGQNVGMAATVRKEMVDTTFAIDIVGICV